MQAWYDVGAKAEPFLQALGNFAEKWYENLSFKKLGEVSKYLFSVDHARTKTDGCRETMAEVVTWLCLYQDLHLKFKADLITTLDCS